MANTFRLYGPEIGIPTAVIDAEVTGVSLDGDIKLTPADNSFETFTINPDRLRKLADNSLAYDKDVVNTDDPIWKAIEDVEGRYKNATDDKDAFTEATRVLFRGAD